MTIESTILPIFMSILMLPCPFARGLRWFGTFALLAISVRAEALVWDALEKTHAAAKEETKAAFVFLATNASTSDVTVTAVDTSCGCTVAGFPKLPWTIAAGETSPLSAVLDFRGKAGQYTKTIVVQTSAGRTILTVNVDATALAVRIDVAALLAQARAMLPADAKGATAVNPNLSESELTKEIQAIADESDGILRYQKIEDLLAALSQTEYPVVLNLMRLPGTDTPGLIDLGAKIFRRWTESAPDRSVAWLSGMPGGTSFGREAFGIAGEAKARGGATEALRWLKQLPEGDNRASAQFAIAGAIARQDPRTALALALELPNSTSRDGLVGYCVLNWSNTDFAAAAKWVTSLQDPAQRNAIGARLATQEAIRNPERAAQFAFATIEAGDEQNRCVSQIVRFWAAAAPVKAAQWVESLPSGALRGTAARALIETWARSDVAAARQWVAECPAADLREIGSATIVTTAPMPTRRSRSPAPNG